MAAIEVDLSNYVTAREYARALDSLQRTISEGFTGVHQRQDVTNGRILRAEEAIAEAELSLEVLNKARLIDKISDLEKRVSDMQTVDRVVSSAKKIFVGFGVTVVGGTSVGVTVIVVRLWLSWMGWHVGS